MKNKKMCRYCGREIDLNTDKLVLLGTYEERSVLDESYFHYDCFVEWFNEKLNEQAKKVAPKPKPKQETIGFGFLGSPNEANDIGNLGDLGNLGELVNGMLGGFNPNQLMKGVDMGGLDIKKDAEKMSQGIKQASDKIRKIAEKKKNDKSKKEEKKKPGTQKSN